MVLNQSTIFRVTGLRDGDSQQVVLDLQTAIAGEATQEELQRVGKITVVPSCYDEKRPVTLLQWKCEIPGFLSHLVKGSVDSYEVETEYGDISFDRHFFGFTQMYATTPGKPVSADIIAITGLDGHAYGSFRGRWNLGRMWLHDFLSADLPSCRTMIYGYKSKLSSRGIDTIIDYERCFLEEMKKIRWTLEAAQRPIFFVAHSFGGIILAYSLVNAALATQWDNILGSLYKATYGILFFGTPHKGLMVEDIQKMVLEDEDHPRNTLLQQIKEKSSASMRWRRPDDWKRCGFCTKFCASLHESELGPFHSDTYRSMCNLAITLKHQGDHKEAELLSRQALEGCKNLLGPLHPHTLLSVNNLASILTCLGKYVEADALNRRALEGYETQFGSLNQYTLLSVNNLANNLESQGTGLGLETRIRLFATSLTITDAVKWKGRFYNR